MPPLEEVPDVPNNSYTYEYLSELPNVIVNLVNEKLIEKSSVSMNYFNDNFCVICQENIQISPKQKCIMRVLECTHAFHIDCVDKWFTTNKTCPTCKYTLD
jgi:E3 ubiquitin-protein ligase ATL41